MERLRFWCFVWALPVVAVLVHDAWFSYAGQVGGFDLSRPFGLNATGALWVHYQAGSYNWARAHIAPGLWHSLITPLLECKAVFVSAIPLLIVVAITLIRYGLNRFRAGASYRRGDTLPTKSKKIFYKRK